MPECSCCPESDTPNTLYLTVAGTTIYGFPTCENCVGQASRISATGDFDGTYTLTRVGACTWEGTVTGIDIDYYDLENCTGNPGYPINETSLNIVVTRTCETIGETTTYYWSLGIRGNAAGAGYKYFFASGAAGIPSSPNYYVVEEATGTECVSGFPTFTNYAGGANFCEDEIYWGGYGGTATLSV